MSSNQRPKKGVKSNKKTRSEKEEEKYKKLCDQFDEMFNPSEPASDPPSVNPTSEFKYAYIECRKEEYKKAANVAFKEGQVALGAQYVNVAKNLERLQNEIKSGKVVDISTIPHSPGAEREVITISDDDSSSEQPAVKSEKIDAEPVFSPEVIEQQQKNHKSEEKVIELQHTAVSEKSLASILSNIASDAGEKCSRGSSLSGNGGTANESYRTGTEIAQGGEHFSASLSPWIHVNKMKDHEDIVCEAIHVALDRGDNNEADRLFNYAELLREMQTACKRILSGTPNSFHENYDGDEESVEEFEEKTAVSHVIFDFDGLLVDTEICYTEVLSRMLKPFGKVFTMKTMKTVMGKSPFEAMKWLITSEGLSDRVSTEEFTKDFEKHLREVFFNAPLMSGAESLVRHLAAHEIPMAICAGSNKKEFEQKSAGHSDLWRLIHPIVYRGDGPVEKNEYFEAMKRFPSRPASLKHVLVVVTAPNSVKDGLGAGCQVVQVPTGPEPCFRMEAEIDAKITVLKSLADFIPDEFGLPAYT